MSQYRNILAGSENQQDDQLLETDIMRFMAIIGIVFWIIFSLVKVLPKEEAAVAAVVERTPIAMKADKAVVEKKQYEDLIPITETVAPVVMVDKEIVSEDFEQENKAQAMQSAPGLHLQFASRDSIQRLMEEGRIKLFASVKSDGFELMFAGRVIGGEITFIGERQLPDSLWKISSGLDHAYFLANLTETFPAVSSFPEKAIFVSFGDEKLEKEMEETFFRLQQDGKNGILSVSGNGRVVFQPAEKATERKRVNRVVRNKKALAFLLLASSKKGAL